MKKILISVLFLSGCAEEVADSAAWLEMEAAPKSAGIAVDITSLPTSCSSTDAQCVFCADSVRIKRATTNPKARVVWEKCDGSAMSTTKTCDVRVGSTGGDSRITFSWAAGTTQTTTLFNVWPSAADFSSAATDSYKEFYLTCNDGGSPHWYSGEPVIVEKQAP